MWKPKYIKHTYETGDQTETTSLGIKMLYA